jgi:hypothetical protein
VNNQIGNLNGKWAFLFKVSMIFMPFACAAQGWILNRLYTMDNKIASVSERIAVIEGNRFTANDALKIWEAVAKTNEKLATVPTEIPPKWVIDRIERTERNIEKITEQIIALRKP